VRGLYSRFAELAARQTDRGMLLKLAEEDLRFQSGMAVLPQGDLPSLDRIAELLLKAHPGLSALIEGHTDSAGPDEINLELSKARADAVRQALIERGVPAERLSAEGAGEGRPIAENASAPAGARTVGWRSMSSSSPSRGGRRRLGSPDLRPYAGAARCRRQ
jgi:chemotaxis protein MotB